MKRKHGDRRAREAADERRPDAGGGGSVAESGLAAAAEPEGAARPAPIPDVVAGRAAGMLALALAVLALARGALGFRQTMWLWGPSVLAFVAPIPGWTLWALAALALIP